MLKRFAFVFFVFFSVVSIEASMISFLVIESGLPQDTERNLHSIRWENTLMDVFFNSGHIVCNIPIQRHETKPSSDSLQSSLLNMEQEAMSGGIDYIIIALLDYSSGSGIPGEISFLIYKVIGRVKVHEKRIRGNAYKTMGDEIDDMKIIAGELIPYFNN